MIRGMLCQSPVRGLARDSFVLSRELAFSLWPRPPARSLDRSFQRFRIPMAFAVSMPSRLARISQRDEAQRMTRRREQPVAADLMDPTRRGRAQRRAEGAQCARPRLETPGPTAIGANLEQKGRFWNGPARILERRWNRVQHALLEHR
jgi:hypothetical protein